MSLHRDNAPVVALESTIITHGMPYPQNVETALLVEKTVRENGAVPATVAILQGKLCVGINTEQIEYLGKKGLAVNKASRVTGVARSAGERNGYPVVDESSLDDVLADTDVLVMILPHSDATSAALNADRLARLRQGALLVNVGRGTTVDEEALVAALESGRLAGAALDVTAVEPLPADSPLWAAPNLILTPHTAGGRPRGADRLLTSQIAALRADRPLRNLIPR